ncbi:MAG: AlkA N-terminal domain-containing protein [Candidatus Eiseniibacteriota bacterium]
MAQGDVRTWPPGVPRPWYTSFMQLDPATCYAALRSKDRRFEGRFFVGVTTTGIYCRPGCPARTPRAEHTRFYPSSAAAEGAGFRPCRRCRPETAPSSPAWLGTSATVTRALRLLGAAPADEPASIEQLAGRLGIGPRHLRRLFAEHVGASPRSMLMTQRVHFARRLLDETNLPLDEVAVSAGFGSTRRFREAVRKTFGRSPARLRRAGALAQARDRAAGERPIELRLPCAGPYDWASALEYRAARAIPGVEHVADGAYRRTIRTANGPGILEVVAERGASALVLRLWLPGTGDLFPLVERVRRMLDLEADPTAIGAQLARDRVLARYVERRPGLRVPGAFDPFELAVRAVLGQQVSVRAATTIAGRLVAAHGTPFPAGERFGLPRLFPEPAALADLGARALARLGLTQARAETLAGFARAVTDGALDLSPAPSLEDAVERLCAIDGIGPWTAHYIALRALGEPDAFPASDLGLRKAFARGGTIPSASALEARAEAWRPWRGYAAIHLWAGPA